MPASFQLTPQASDDLDEIWTFIARDSIDAANRVEDAIVQACNLLADNPLLGLRRTLLTSRDVRFWTVTRFRNYIIAYLPQTRPLQIIAVLHGKRQIAALLRRHERI